MKGADIKRQSYLIAALYLGSYESKSWLNLDFSSNGTVAQVRTDTWQLHIDRRSYLTRPLARPSLTAQERAIQLVAQWT